MSDVQGIVRVFEKIAEEIGNNHEKQRNNWWDKRAGIHCVKWKEAYDGIEFEHEQCRAYHYGVGDPIPSIPAKKTS